MRPFLLALPSLETAQSHTQGWVAEPGFEPTALALAGASLTPTLPKCLWKILGLSDLFFLPPLVLILPYPHSLDHLCNCPAVPVHLGPHSPPSFSPGPPERPLETVASPSTGPGQDKGLNQHSV